MKLIEKRTSSPIKSFGVPEIGGTFGFTLARRPNTLEGRQRFVLTKSGFGEWDIDEEQAPLLVEALMRRAELAR